MRTKVCNDFVKQALGMAELPGKRGYHGEEVRWVWCPRCQVGGAEFKLKLYKSALVGSFEEPAKCSACGQQFFCRPRVTLEGVVRDGR